MRLPSLVFVLLIAGCATSAPPLPEELAAAIPPGANTVELRSDASVDELFAAARRMLTDRGFTIAREDALLYRIETDQAEIGQRTALRVVLQTASVGSGSRLEAVAYWSSDMGAEAMESAGPGVSGVLDNWWRAEWEASQRATHAFGQLALMLDQLPHVEAVYQVK